MDPFQITFFSEKSQFVATLRANNSGGASPSRVRSDEEKELNAVAVEEADGEKWYLDKVMIAAKVNGSGLREKFRELKTVCQPVHTEAPAGWVDLV